MTMIVVAKIWLRRIGEHLAPKSSGYVFDAFVFFATYGKLKPICANDGFRPLIILQLKLGNRDCLMICEEKI